MVVISQNEFAKMAGVTQGAVCKALKTGRLAWAVDEHGKRGIDPDSDTSVAMLTSTAARKLEKLSGPKSKPVRQPKPKAPPKDKPPKKSKGQPPDKPRKPPAVRHDSVGSSGLVALAEQEKELNVRLKQLKADKERHAQLVRTRKYIPASMVMAGWGRIGTALEDNFRPFADRIAPSLAAIYKAGGTDKEIRELIDIEIDKSMVRAMKTVDREINKIKLDSPARDGKRNTND